MSVRLTTFEFVCRSQKIHGNKYDYSLVHYNDAKTKIILVCKVHGKFKQNPYHHLNGSGCLQCGIQDKVKGAELFKQEARKIHGELYDYSQVVYMRNSSKVKIVCKKHGEFLQTPTNHLSRKQGCPKCVSIISKPETDFLDYLKIPNTKENRQVCVLGKRVDGMVKKQIYEFLGDYWHGNPNKFNSSDINGHTQKTFGELRENVWNKFKKLKSAGYDVKYIWESDWKKWLKSKNSIIPIQNFDRIPCNVS
jgi:hypothetical protein